MSIKQVKELSDKVNASSSVQAMAKSPKRAITSASGSLMSTDAVRAYLGYGQS